jgi:hypothetical protein
VVAAIGVLIARPWQRGSAPSDDATSAADAASSTDASAGATSHDAASSAAAPADATSADAGATLPADAGRAGRNRRPPRDAGAPRPALPIDARQRTMVDLDNDGIPDRR